MKRAVYNSTRRTLLVSDLEVAETGWQRMRGLIGRSAKDFLPGKGLWLRSCEGIHTIGMVFPIDVAYLDSDHRVVHMYHSLQPFRIGRILRKVKSILELPAKVLEESETEIGDQLQFNIPRDMRF
jgi:uncharacterized membrane protein (UPF0127 family)